MSAERTLIDAVVTSLLNEMPDSNGWTINKLSPTWRNPAMGQVLNVYCTARVATGEQNLGHLSRRVDMVLEYVEPAPAELIERLERDEVAELDAYDTAAAFDDWAQNHRNGFLPAKRMDLMSITHVPGETREGLVRYCTTMLQFTVC